MLNRIFILQLPYLLKGIFFIKKILFLFNILDCALTPFTFLRLIQSCLMSFCKLEFFSRVVQLFIFKSVRFEARVFSSYPHECIIFVEKILPNETTLKFSHNRSLTITSVENEYRGEIERWRLKRCMSTYSWVYADARTNAGCKKLSAPNGTFVRLLSFLRFF